MRRGVLTFTFASLLFVVVAETSVRAQSECGRNAFSPNAEYKGVSACKPVAEKLEIYGDYGWQYECVEYVRRFYGKALHHTQAKGGQDDTTNPWRGDGN